MRPGCVSVSLKLPLGALPPTIYRTNQGDLALEGPGLRGFWSCLLPASHEKGDGTGCLTSWGLRPEAQAGRPREGTHVLVGHTDRPGAEASAGCLALRLDSVWPWAGS